MPPAGRITRQQAAKENNENVVSTRSHAKASADDGGKAPLKKALSTTQAGHRKRAALGDVSNVNKIDPGEGKKAGVKAGGVSKAAAPTGVQKHATRAASRTALAAKETNKKIEVKRTGSGSGALGAQKRKLAAVSTSVTTSTKIAAAEVIRKKTAVKQALLEGEPQRKKVHTLEAQKRSHDSDLAAKPTHIVPWNPAPSVGHEYPSGVKDLDSEDLEDPLMAAEYVNDVFEYLRDLECKSGPNPQYMDHQDDIEWKTRGILIDWLVEVHTRFNFLAETLFLAVSITDRFLSQEVIQLERLQLVGITAMLIASKYEESISPQIDHFSHITDDGFTVDDILDAERFLLSTLNYDLSYPNPMNFLRRISKADNYDVHCRTIAKYLMEISLLDHRFMAYRPSHVAAAAMYLSRLILDRGDWDETVAYYAGYAEDEIEPVFLLMIDYLARPVIHEAFFRKYANKKFHKVSIHIREWAAENARHFGIVNTNVRLDELDN